MNSPQRSASSVGNSILYPPTYKCIFVGPADDTLAPIGSTVNYTICILNRCTFSVTDQPLRTLGSVFCSTGAITAGGAITGATVAVAGSGYNVGDIITPTQSGAGQTGGEFVITSVKSGVPVAAQSIEFKVQAGQYLPIAVDYITNLANPMTDADIVICK